MSRIETHAACCGIVQEPPTQPAVTTTTRFKSIALPNPEVSTSRQHSSSPTELVKDPMSRWLGRRSPVTPSPPNPKWGSIVDLRSWASDGATGIKYFFPNRRAPFSSMNLAPGLGKGSSSIVPGFGSREWGQPNNSSDSALHGNNLQAICIEAATSSLLPQHTRQLATRVAELDYDSRCLLSRLLYSRSLWHHEGSLPDELPTNMIGGSGAAFIERSTKVDLATMKTALFALPYPKLRMLWSSKVVEAPKDSASLVQVNRRDCNPDRNPDRNRNPDCNPDHDPVYNTDPRLLQAIRPLLEVDAGLRARFCLTQ